MKSTLHFGIIQLQNRPWATLVENCQKVESLGFDSFWVGDHFVNGHNLEEDWLDGWSVIAALAAQTQMIRIGPPRHEYHLSQPCSACQTSPHS